MAFPNYSGFVNLDDKGKPKMLPYTPGSGAGVFNQVMGNPAKLGSLLGVPGASTGVSTGGMGGAADPGVPSVGAGGGLPTDLLGQAAGNLSSELKGELPQDVQDMLEQQAAEYGVGSGTQGSQFQGYRGLRNLGLTSLDLSKHATDLLANQFTSPAEQARIDLANRQFGEGQREFGITQSQREREFKAQQALEQQRFAAEQNRLQRELQLQELQSLGIKYGGLGNYGGYGYQPTARGPSIGIGNMAPQQYY